MARSFRVDRLWSDRAGAGELICWQNLEAKKGRTEEGNAPPRFHVGRPAGDDGSEKKWRASVRQDGKAEAEAEAEEEAEEEDVEEEIYTVTLRSCGKV